jgi:hypothetical protein
VKIHFQNKQKNHTPVHEKKTGVPFGMDSGWFELKKGTPKDTFLNIEMNNTS